MSIPLIIQDFLKQQGPIFFVTPDPRRAIGLETILPNFHIVTSQTDPLVEEACKGRFFISPSPHADSGHLLRDEMTLAYIKQQAGEKKANVLTFKAGPMVAKVCAENGFCYLGPDWKLNRRWEDKIFFAEKCAQLKISNARSYIAHDEMELRKTLSDPLWEGKVVLQLARGHSGNSSFLLNSAEEVLRQAKKFPGRKYKLSPFMVGETYTLDAVVGAFGVQISAPILQITGLRDFNRHLLGTCGNDYAFAARHLPPAARKSMRKSAQKIAVTMQAEGYRGFLGFDFVMEGETTHLIEVNPRLVGSVPVFTKLQLAAGEIPFLLLHILEFLDFDFNRFTFPLVSDFTFNFSQLLTRNLRAEAVQVEKTLSGGIYTLKEEGPVWLRPAYFATAATLAVGEFFLHTVGAGSAISPDKEYAGLQFGCGIMKNNSALEDFAYKAAQAVREHIILT